MARRGQRPRAGWLPTEEQMEQAQPAVQMSSAILQSTAMFMGDSFKVLLLLHSLCEHLLIRRVSLLEKLSVWESLIKALMIVQ